MTPERLHSEVVDHEKDSEHHEQAEYVESDDLDLNSWFGEPHLGHLPSFPSKMSAIPACR
ncbi:hypothetical protein GCM10023226_29120 [Nocardioides nanhaiensis]|uniref:Uncharacterized protein n=1 Tax=Nocardioides nanhaiensis TaxID=1476871 RepID=A0ABP8WI85_9ACTN